MGSFGLVILDAYEVKCQVKGCQNIANQDHVIVKKYKAKVQRFCLDHYQQYTLSQEGKERNK